MFNEQVKCHTANLKEKFNYLLTQQNEAQSLISQYVPSDHSFSQTTILFSLPCTK